MHFYNFLEVPLSQNVLSLRFLDAVNSGDLCGSPSSRLSATSVLSCGSAGVEFDTSYASTPKTRKSRQQKRAEASSVTQTPTEISEPKSVSRYYLRSSARASKLQLTSGQSLKQSAKLSQKQPCSFCCTDPGVTFIEKVAMSKHSKYGALPKHSRTTENSRTEEACSPETPRVKLPLKSSYDSPRDIRKK